MPEPTSPTSDPRLRWLMETLTARLGEVIAAMTGERPSSGWQSDAAPAMPLTPGTIVCRQSFALAAGASLWVVAAEQAWRQTGERILRVAGIEDAETETVRGTFLEIVNQTSAAVAREISALLRREVISEAGSESALPSGLTDWFGITLKFGEGEAHHVAACFTNELIESLAPPQPAREINTLAAGSEPGNAPAGSAVKPASLDLLLDVELPVSVSFGRAQLPLKDVIKLTTGSIVELNRTVAEPVEVIVNNCVIARGEVVVVEGNFGVRILQVIRRQERLRTLD